MSTPGVPTGVPKRGFGDVFADNGVPGLRKTGPTQPGPDPTPRKLRAGGPPPPPKTRKHGGSGKGAAPPPPPPSSKPTLRATQRNAATAAADANTPLPRSSPRGQMAIRKAPPPPPPPPTSRGHAHDAGHPAVVDVVRGKGSAAGPDEPGVATGAAMGAAGGAQRPPVRRRSQTTTDPRVRATRGRLNVADGTAIAIFPVIEADEGDVDVWKPSAVPLERDATAEVELLKLQLQRQRQAFTAQIQRLETKVAETKRKLSRQWEVQKEDIARGREIGRGRFGIVLHARWGGTFVAAKTIHPTGAKSNRDAAMECLRVEHKVLSTIQHPNVVRFLGFCASPLIVLMALAECSLDDELSDETVVWTMARRVQIARGVAAGMTAVHRRDVLHLDLKPGNILLAADGTPWITDFGVSMKIATTMSSACGVGDGSGPRGTHQYCAPELVRPQSMGGAIYGKPADVYSFGILLWQLFTGEQPHGRKQIHEIYAEHFSALQNGTAPLLPTCADGHDWRMVPGVTPRSVVAVIEAAWRFRPEDRPPFEALLAELDTVAVVFPVEDAGSVAARAMVSVRELHAKLALAEGERDALLDASFEFEGTLHDHLVAASDEIAALQQDSAAAAQELAAAQTALRSSTVRFPEYWSHQCDDGGDHGRFQWWRSGRQLVGVGVGSAQWDTVEGLLRASLPAARLVTVERWEDRLLWRDYSARRDRIALKRDGNPNELQLWHGTGVVAPMTVLQHETGLDPRFSSGGFYGRGMYLAEHARYSAESKYAHCPDPTDPLLRQLLLVRAAVGEARDYGHEIHRKLSKPPRQEFLQNAGLLFDSVKGGPHRPHKAGPGKDDSVMFVLYDLAQAYPEYVVTFQN